jgi:ribonucleoside-diphosphate reductase alpha chain
VNLNDFSPIVEMPPQAISEDVLREKYAKDDEASIDDVQRRVARALAQVEKEPIRELIEVQFIDALRRGFIPGGRIMSAAGTSIRATLINCFVQPVGDSVSDDVDSQPSIYKALTQAAETMRRGGGVGYDFSRVRPRGALVKGTHSNASGPVSFMQVFDASCETVESAGARRGAQMGVIRCDHPDVAEFVHSKDSNRLRNFNISVGITDVFMEAVEADGEFELVHPALPSRQAIEAGAYQRGDGNWVYRKVRARELLDDIVHATYDHADPGVLFLDTINAENNLAYAEVIEASNPCGEQSLPAYGCCCLGSIDLTRFVRDAFTPSACFDWAGFTAVAMVAVRMLDNVLDLTVWPLEEQRREAMAKRRVGLGFLGLGSALVMQRLAYNSSEGLAFGAKVARTLRDAAYRASIELAREKGPFPLLDSAKYLKGQFAHRLPADIRRHIQSSGIRNSHLLSIAPTGTTALAFADNASNGIEPAFTWAYTRKKRMPDDSTMEYQVEDHAYRLYKAQGGDVTDLPAYFVGALDMSADDHVAMLETVQPFVDAAISKTVNVPRDYPFEDFRGLYMRAWRAGLKGLATFRPNDLTGSVLSAEKPLDVDSSATALDDDPLRKPIDSRPGGDLEGVTSKVEYYTSEGKRSVYITINFMRVVGTMGGKPVEIQRPVEFFVPAGQRDEGQQWISSNMRMLSMIGRSGSPIEKALQNMREVVWDKGPVQCGVVAKEGGRQAKLWHDSEVAAIGYWMQQMLAKRGFLDANGNQVPTALLSARLSRQLELTLDAPSGGVHGAEPQASDRQFTVRGKKCHECGAHAVQRVDGCDRCAECGAIGHCG